MPENAEQASAPRRPKHASGMPYSMPDGRPLSAFLTDYNLLKAAPRRHNTHRRSKASREPPHGWSTPLTGAAAAALPIHTPARAPTDAELAEVAALQRVGQRRQRRWLNDRLLRDMAPALTAKDMESLFKPAPFGDTGHVSAFTLAAAPEHAALWDLFRSVDADKQARVLAKWAEHVQELQDSAQADSGEGSAAAAAAEAAVKGWAAVGPRARKALRRAPHGCVHELETEVAQFMDSSDDGELVLRLEDGFQRLLAHGLAEFYGLLSFSRTAGDGVREVVIRRRHAPSEAAASSSAAARRISCADVVWMLEEGEGVNVTVTALGTAPPLHAAMPPVVVGVVCAS